MTRNEFMEALGKRLDKLPAEERDNALDYYNEIFMDAGEENEEKTAEELGSIDDIARQIYTENGIDPDGRAKFLVEEYFEQNIAAGGAAEGTMPYVSPFQASPQKTNGAGLLVFILLFPVWFPVITVVLALAFVLVVVMFVLQIVFLAVGVAGVISGITMLFRIPPVGLSFFGAGLVLLGLFGLTCKVMLKGIKNTAVGAFNGVINACRRIVLGGAA